MTSPEQKRWRCSGEILIDRVTGNEYHIESVPEAVRLAALLNSYAALESQLRDARADLDKAMIVIRETAHHVNDARAEVAGYKAKAKLADKHRTALRHLDAEGRYIGGDAYEDVLEFCCDFDALETGAGGA